MEISTENPSLKKGRHRKKQLYNMILEQMEFYFSDSNLSKDRFLSQLIQEDPYVELSNFLKFNKIRKLTESVDDLKKAIKKSELLELSEDTEKIRRKTEFKPKENVDDCTIYVEKINSDASHEFLTSIFSDYGHVTYVSIPKYRHNQMNKGFAFVEFEKETEAQNAVNYFESIGSKISSNFNPENLCSISSFVKENEGNINGMDSETCENALKRKRSISDSENIPTKKIKDAEQSEDTIVSDEKKKKKKENKKKTLIKELGLQVLSKQEWKKMRNCYLNMQRKKMKEIKVHLSKSKHTHSEKNPGTDAQSAEKPIEKLEYIPGTIVKIILPEPCQSDKKIKIDIKASSKDIKYVDVPLGSGSEEVFVRFTNNEGAEKFCKEEFNGTKKLLEGDEEKEYWNKIENDRNVKFQKTNKKQRGKDKLLRKAEKHLAKHTRFDETD